ncbi:MAG: TolC family protein [Nitrosomonadales bacterium]|nr:TolC family protein [Nitrosomonadales bacterium]
MKYSAPVKPPVKRLAICALLCLCSRPVVAGEISDPFGTEALAPMKPAPGLSERPALRPSGAVGDPCAEAVPNDALDRAPGQKLFGLPDVVNLALCNNPQTREAWASARVQAAQVGISRASYLPSASMAASGERIWVDTASAVNQHSIGLSLSYLLYDFGARDANLENARQLLDAAAAAQDSTVQTVFLSAVQSFYQTQAALAALDAAHESERAAKESFAAAEARYNAGSATPADKLQAQTAYSQATLNRITADGNMKNAKGALANILGLDANRNVPLAAAEGFSVSLALSREGKGDNSDWGEGEALKIFERDVAALIEEARQHRPDLYAAAAQVKAAEANADAARAADKPSVSLAASANQNTRAGDTSRGSSVGITLSVPIFSGYAPTYRIRAAEAQVETKNAQLERLRLQVALDVWTAYQNLTTATQSLRSTADLLNSAEQSERVALGRYKAGVGNMLDVLNAQSALAGARQQRIQSTFNWNISRATLAQAMGSLDIGLLQTLPDSSEQPGAGSQQKRSRP